MPVVPQSFTCNSILGVGSEDAPMICSEEGNTETLSMNHDNLLVLKMQQFTNSINNKDNDSISLSSDSSIEVANAISKD